MLGIDIKVEKKKYVCLHTPEVLAGLGVVQRHVDLRVLAEVTSEVAQRAEQVMRRHLPLHVRRALLADRPAHLHKK